MPNLILSYLVLASIYPSIHTCITPSIQPTNHATNPTMQPIHPIHPIRLSEIYPLDSACLSDLIKLCSLILSSLIYVAFCLFLIQSLNRSIYLFSIVLTIHLSDYIARLSILYFYTCFVQSVELHIRNLVCPQDSFAIGAPGLKICRFFSLNVKVTNTKPGWWLTNPSEKYESQWEGLSHMLWKIKVMFETTNQQTHWNFLLPSLVQAQTWESL